MNANLDKIAQDLYGKIQTRFSNIKIGDESGKVLERKQDIPHARFFEFEYKENGESLGTVSITLDEDDGIIVEISGDLADCKHPGAFKFFRSFRQFAKDRLLNFNLQNIGKDSLDKRDYTFRAKPKEEPMNPIMENKMYGTTRMSYQDLGEARLVVKHSQPVNLDLAAGRTMHIESIYVENADGERFKYPYKHLNGARALAEHIKAGGTPYDAIGKHISSLSEELAQLRKFKGYVGRNEALSEAVGGLTDVVSERIEQIKKEVNSLQRPSYYQAFAESFTSRDEEMIPEEILNDFIDRLTIRTFNEDLKQSFPYIFRLIDESDIPVRELSADDILGEGGITLGADGKVDPNGFTPEKQMALNQMVQQQQNAKAGDKDLGDGFTLTTVQVAGETLPAVLDTQSNTYITRNQHANGGTAIYRTMAPYILVIDGKPESAMKVGPATTAALQKAGLAVQQSATSSQAPAPAPATSSPSGKPWSAEYQGSPAPYTITVSGKDYKFAGHTETGPGTGPVVKVPQAAIGIRGIAPVTVELGNNGMFYKAAPQQESYDPELAFESFINNIAESDEDDYGQGILDINPTVKQNAIKKLNDFFKTDVSTGIGGVNLEELTKLIPIPEFKEKIDELVSLTKDESDKDVSTTIEMILTDLAQNNSDLAEIMQNGLIDFNGDGGEIGGEEEPPAPDLGATPPPEATPPAPEATPPAPDLGATPPPEAGAEAIPPGPEATPTPPPVAEEILRLRKLSGLNEGMNGAGVSSQATPGNPVPSQHGEIVKKDLPPMDMNPGSGAKPANPNMSKMKAKFIQARECGAELHHELDFGHKTMTLHDAIRECGLTPMECGFGDQEAANEHASGVHQMLSSVAGFWNRENKNFTIGGTRAKTKIIKGFKEGEFPNASQEDLDQVLHIIDKMDPSHSGHELDRIKHLAGHHEASVGEDQESFDMNTLMQQFKAMQNDPQAMQTLGQDIQKILGDKMATAQQQMPNQNIEMPGGGAQINPADMMKNIMSKINFGN